MANKFASWVYDVGEKLGWWNTITKKDRKKYGDEIVDQGLDLTERSFKDQLNDDEKQFFEDSTKNMGLAKGLLSGADGLLNKGEEYLDALTGKGANDTNKEIADENLDFQREKFDYEKGLQQELFDREDTSYQRTVNDMRLAGLNPLNMQNTNGSGEAIATTGLHNDYTANPTRQLEALNMLFSAAQQSITTTSNSSLNNAQANLLNQQAENQRIKNMYEQDVLAAQLSSSYYDNSSKYFDVHNKLRNYQMNELFGWTDNMPEWMKQSSARLGFKPLDFPKIDNFNEVLGHPEYYWFTKKSNMNMNSQLSAKLLGDELLTGSLGIFGNILRLLTK